MEKPRSRDVSKFPKVIGPVNGGQNLRPGSLVPSHSSFSPPSPVSFPRSPTPLSPVSPTLVPTLPPQGLGLPPLTGLPTPAPSTPAHHPLFQAWPVVISSGGHSWHFWVRHLQVCPGLRGFLGWRLSCQTLGNLPQSPGLFFLSWSPDFYIFPACLSSPGL